ncbi:aldehyde dehydrogenase family protein [Streptomyces sp. NPDC006798]|uniref:aldehyde dehydrogenase family protein n=1 Tax=Streptomyces sp. NPDC006798 TaxID=3155462 RepID=UPI0033FDDDFA
MTTATTSTTTPAGGVGTDARDRGLPVVNPATGRVFAHAPVSTPEGLDRVVDAAAGAFGSWSALPPARRRALLRRCRTVLADHEGELAGLLTREQGKPLRDALREVRSAADWFARTAALGLRGRRLVDDGTSEITLQRVPYGVVAAIAPSNFPLLLAVCKIAPALLAGNTVVLKPAPETPLSSLLMVELLAGVLPPGTLGVVCGDGAVGERLTRHEAVRLISFTGSIPVGRAIAGAAAAGLKGIVLELGGNDPAVVLPDADPEEVAPRLFAHAMANSGQFCAAVKRVYVPRARHDRYAELLGALARSAVVGDGADPATELGPLVSAAQRDRVAALVEGAVAAGARLVAGGTVPTGPGWFYPPTVVAGLPPGTELEAEEQFGPVIPLVAYDSVPEAVERAGAGPHALGWSFWGDEREARELASRVECGTVWINTHGDLRHDVPFGGHRESGVGVEYGSWGLLEFTRIKVRNIAVRERSRTP